MLDLITASIHSGGSLLPAPRMLASFAFGSSSLAHLSPLDIAVIVIYFAMVMWIGFYLKKRANTSEEFFMAGREMTAWIAGLSFVSANLGSLELMGWAGSAYQYGILAAHWYWIGAVPAMLFLGMVMMPFYYVSKTHSVPGYLKLRFGQGSSTVAAVSFAFMTILMSGVNMFSMALVMKVVLGWDITFSIVVSSLAVAAYVALGGLRSAIFNEVLQFVLIWGGALLVPILGLIEAHGWTGLKAQIIHNFPTQDYLHMWKGIGHFTDNPMGVHWTGIVFGLGFVISFGYWTTDFLVVQRVLAANSLRSARMAPVIGSFFKMAVPFIVILPGLLALVVLHNPDGSLMHLVGEDVVSAHPGAGMHSYNEVLPLMLVRYCSPGLLGLGITALIAGFMSGMAGNVSAFAAVWTYDIYQPLINKKAPDQHYVAVGRWATILGVMVSIGAAYLVMNAKGIMDYVQALFSFFIAPLLGSILMGMFWKRGTKAGGFWGLLLGTTTSIALFLWVYKDPSALRYVAFSADAKAMAENMYRALWSFSVTVLVTFVVSMFGTPRPVAELNGLVYGATKLPKEDPVPFYKNEWYWTAIAIVIFVGLNIIFW
ncbi:MAG TPA: sodium:solute symporter family protein [Acidobacteriaceae bacterium]|jgi:SSS family solute:Na+ symporter|nr:sodium:solute symporter family protein [Acidobacteriaceae bacterium]